MNRSLFFLLTLFFFLSFTVFAEDDYEDDYYSFISGLFEFSKNEIYVSQSLVRDQKAYKVALLMGQENQVVKSFVDNFVNYYGKNDCDVIGIKDIRKYDLMKYDVVISIASEGANLSKENFNRKALNIWCLVLSPEVIGVPSGVVVFYPYPDFLLVFKDIKNRYPNKNNVGIIYNLGGYSVKYAVEVGKKEGLNIYPINVNNYNVDKIEESLNKFDAIFLLPDVFVLDEDNLLKLIYYCKRKDKLLISTQKILLNYGVDIIYALDYGNLAFEIIDFIKNYGLKKIKYENVFPEKFVIIEKNYQR